MVSNVDKGTADVRHTPREPLIPRILVTPQDRARLILVALAFLVLYWLLNKSIDALGPFIFALVLGYLMAPLVERLDNFMPRGLAILVVYAIFISAIAGIILWLAPVVGGQVEQLAEDAPDYYKRAQEWSASVTAWYGSLPLSPEMRQNIENGARNSLGAVGTALQEALGAVLRLATRTMGFVVGFIIIPFWLFYVMKDSHKAVGAINNMLPHSWRVDCWRILRIINGVLSSYIRGQLLLGLIVGVATTIGMLIIGAPYAVILGIISGLTEVIPVVGPILGAVPGLLIAAFSGDVQLAIKMLVVYILVQQLENNLLVPRVQGDSVKLHPAIIMVALVVGSQVGGLFGLIAAVPVAAILRDVYLYLYRRFTEEYTPKEAEASVPSRQDEQTDEGKKRQERELAEERNRPGLSSDEVIADMEADGDKALASHEK